MMSTSKLIKALKSAISALQHGRRSTAQKKVASVDAQFDPKTTQTTEIRFSNTTELVEFIEGMDGCGLITDLDLVASGIQARCFPE